VTKYKVVVKDVLTGKAAFKTTVTLPKAKTETLPSKTYQWFVKACNAQGCNKSAKFKFTN